MQSTVPAGLAFSPADRVPDNALHAVVVFTNQPHARLVSIDLSKVVVSPGVKQLLQPLMFQ